MWKFEKRAGLILDQQDDPGFGWDKIASFWPDDMDRPDIGIDLSEANCIAELSDGHTKLAKYPTDSPENTLASSMYFLMYGIDSIEKRAHKHIAQGLKNARVAWDVSIPDGFVDYVRSTSFEKEASVEDDVFADSEGNLPVTTENQCRRSIDVFEKHASRWNASERMIIGRSLQEAADYHGLGINVRYAGMEMSKNASGAINVRERVMKNMYDHPGRVQYLSSLDEFRTRLANLEDYNDLVAAANELEHLDKEAGMDIGWGDFFPDPVESLLEGVSEDLFPDLTKHAERDYDAIDWSGLANYFDEDIANQIAADPQGVIPTLPTPQRNIVEDYINERIRSK